VEIKPYSAEDDSCPNSPVTLGDGAASWCINPDPPQSPGGAWVN
jgi:hypothetical protein